MTSVSIHAFRGEGDPYERRVVALNVPFQSTPSGGKATAAATIRAGICGFQSTPSGGKATRDARISVVRHMFQSTPSGGKATRYLSVSLSDPTRFNPRLPGGRRRKCLVNYFHTSAVSIHAFRGEGDGRGSRHRAGVLCVSIHAFRGEGDLYRYSSSNPGRFQSTPSGGKATH